MMVIDYHEKNLAKKLGREAKDIDMSLVEGVFDECEKNEAGRINKESMSAWVKSYMSKHNDCTHDHKLVLEKIISSKEDKLANFKEGHEHHWKSYNIEITEFRKIHKNLYESIMYKLLY